MAGAQQHEGDTSPSPDNNGCRRADPVAWVAHRRELPSLELLRSALRDARERILQTPHEILGGSIGESASWSSPSKPDSASFIRHLNARLADKALQLLYRAMDEHLGGPI